MKGLNTSSWCNLNLDHLIQKDSFNCGVYIIYFFHKLTKNYNLTDFIDINQYRNELKLLLLTKSSNMRDKCLFCRGETTDKNYFTCRLCNRFIHNKCLLTQMEIDKNVKTKDKKLNNICDICRKY